MDFVQICPHLNFVLGGGPVPGHAGKKVIYGASPGPLVGGVAQW